MRGTGEGHRPWDLEPNSTMTNANVEAAVSGVNGQTLTMKYKGGEKTVAVTPQTVVVTSTLARTADALLDRLWSGETTQLPAVTNLPLLGFTWMGYLAGAVAGTLLLGVMPYPLLVPVALLGLLLLI